MSKFRTFLNFIQEVRSEAFKITWPTRDVVIRSAVMILVFAAIMASYFFIVDGIMNKIVGWVF